jgi:translation initiation factor IF-2
MENYKEISSELTISDMKVLANIIEVLVNRGALKAKDLTLIGNIYDKIAQLISTNDSSQQSRQ